MPTDAETALEALTRIVKVVGRDRRLRAWFSRFAQRSAVERNLGILALIERMTVEQEEAELVASIRLLADPRVFEAVRLALIECGYLD